MWKRTLLLVSLLPWISVKGQTTLDCSYQGVTQLPDGLELRHIINPVEETVTMELKYAGQGWLSLGFSNTGMVNATTVVGLPDEGTVQKYEMTGKSPDTVNPTDANPTLTNASIEQTETETILKFTKPLVEQGELAVSMQGSNTIIWAVGTANPWGNPHFLYGSFSLELDTCMQLDCSFQGETELPDGLVLKQITNQVDKTVTMQLIYQGQGWLSLGFSNTGMIGATTVVGLPEEGSVEKYLMTGKTPDTVGPTSVNPTLTEASIVQTETETILTYTKPLVEEGELEVVQGGSNTIIWAVGSANAWGNPHFLYGSFTLNFDTCIVPVELDCSFQGETELPDGLVLKQITNQVDKTVTMQLIYQGQGWLSLGFSNTGMIGATTVVGLPEEGSVEKYLMTGKTPDTVGPTSVNPTLTEASIVQTETETILTYTKPLVEEGELEVVQGGSNTIIWAVGTANAWGNPHFLYGSFTLNFDTCIDPSETNEGDTTEPGVSEDLDCSLYSTIEILPGLLTLKEVLNQADSTVTMEVAYEGLGYVSLAFSSNGFMVGNMAVVGTPIDNKVAKYYLGGKTTSTVRQAEDDKQTLTDAMIMQNETHTVMRFTKPLEEPGELAVSAEGSNTVIFATGTTNDLFSGFHDNFGAFQVTFTPCVPAGSEPVDGDRAVADLFNDEVPNESLWKVHGYFMAIAWGVLVPLAIGVSLARNLLPDGMWFVLHRGLNGLALLFNIVGFAIAVRLINDSTAPDQSPKHFQDVNHRTIGLVVFLVAMLQAGVAFFRPSNPHAPAAKDAPENTAEFQMTETNHSDSPANAEDGKPFIRTAWELKHRFIGAALLGLSWYNVHSGIDLYEERFGESATDATLVFWIVVGAIAGLIGVATLLSKTKSS